MTTIYIIRHAEVEYEYDDQGRKLTYPPEIHISQEGRDQMNAFAQSLKAKGIAFDSIEASSYTRAVETAEILANTLGTKTIHENPLFVDSYIPGWYALPMSAQQELMDKGEDIYMHPRSDNQEPYGHIAERMMQGFTEVAKHNEGKTVAIVSHGDPIRLLLYRLEHPTGEIPNMSILSKEGYLKRGEAFRVGIDNEGKIVETELLSNLAGVPGERELYVDNLHSSVEKQT